MISWFKSELEYAKRVHMVNVKDLGFGEMNEKGEITKPLEEIAVMDLTNDEMMIIQQDEEMKNYPGTASDPSSPRGQYIGIMITYRRMAKGAGGDDKLGFSESDFMKFTTTRTGALAKRINEHLSAVQKKLKNSEEVQEDFS